MIIKDSKEKKQYSIGDITNRVILGDALEVLPKIPEESFDLVFIDPPYFLQLPKKRLKRWNEGGIASGVEDRWDKFDSFEEYDNFIQKLLKESRRVMKETGTIWVIATYHSMFRIGKVMQDMGFWILNDVIWAKTNPMPNFLGVRFTNATETLIWAKKDKKAKGYTFHREEAVKAGWGKTGQNIWSLPICQGNERIKGESGDKLHSTQKPLSLLNNIILITSEPGDLILDPVAGTGTTAHSAKMLGRNFVLIEREEKYVYAIKERLNSLR